MSFELACCLLATAAALLPTLSTAFCNCSFEIPRCLVQYWTSWGSCMLIFERSWKPVFFKSSMFSPPCQKTR